MAEICEQWTKISHPQSVLWTSIIFWGKIEWSFVSLSQLQKLGWIQFHVVDCSLIIWASFKILWCSLLHNWNYNVEWFAVLFEMFLTFSNIFKDRWCMACHVFLLVLYFACKSAILHAINTHVNAEIPMQDCSERKIEGSPVLWTCEIQGAQHMICMKKTYFSGQQRAKVGHHRPLGSARAQPSPWPAL